MVDIIDRPLISLCRSLHPGSKVYRRIVRYISLLEVVIALFLLSVISFSIVFPFRQLTRSRISVAQGYVSVHARSVLQLRLQELFERIDHISLAGPNGGRLSFTCMQSWDQDPRFCGKIEGELGCQKEGLVLTWGSLQGVKRSQCLFENVSDVHWDFFDAVSQSWVSGVPKMQDIAYVRLVIEKAQGVGSLRFVFHTTYERTNGISI